MDRIDKVKGTFDRRRDMKRDQPSEATVRRLPRYYRHLQAIVADGVLRISSSELAERMGVTASQIRQDLSCFGDFGQQGYGYNVRYLLRKVSEILGMTAGHRAVLLGFGDTARALLSAPVFARRAIIPVAAFDPAPPADAGELPVYPLEELSRRLPALHATVAVLTLPPEEASATLPLLAACGIRGVLNYAPVELTPPTADMTVQNVRLDDPCLLLCYRIGRTENNEEQDE